MCSTNYYHKETFKKIFYKNLDSFASELLFFGNELRISHNDIFNPLVQATLSEYSGLYHIRHRRPSPSCRINMLYTLLNEKFNHYTYEYIV